MTVMAMAALLSRNDCFSVCPRLVLAGCCINRIPFENGKKEKRKKELPRIELVVHTRQGSEHAGCISQLDHYATKSFVTMWVW
jgi:hypothetical protein